MKVLIHSGMSWQAGELDNEKFNIATRLQNNVTLISTNKFYWKIRVLSDGHHDQNVARIDRFTLSSDPRSYLQTQSWFILWWMPYILYFSEGKCTCPLLVVYGMMVNNLLKHNNSDVWWQITFSSESKFLCFENQEFNWSMQHSIQGIVMCQTSSPHLKQDTGMLLSSVATLEASEQVDALANTVCHGIY